MSIRYHIGRFAKLVDRSVHAIRWYEAQGLIPAVDRDAGGRRVYEDEHVEHLLFLERMRRTGMSVAEMRRLTELSMQGWRTLEARKSVLKDHRAEIEAKIADLGAAVDDIDAKIAFYDEWARNKRRPRKQAGPV
ncbi:MerR family transcriptional regulator [Phenylobacterium sp. 20VBR1]|uniref:MerR family transcriptional regulator n=1 Tax=Phenylobacterium glaciei TaxID=2803784 RepID=A0A941HVH6_9CAUL|nr:MerR family transcriptional regulator [Phenylobacterium glaciei]QQZ51424.1 MerR family transcriptional regulator [Phenylobacterium glaciei]